MTDTEKTLLQFHMYGFLLVAVACAVVAVLSKCYRVRQVALGSAVPLFISSITYWAVFALDNGSFRWLGYTLACGLFAYDTAFVLGRTEKRSAFSGMLMSVVLFTGFLGYLADGADLTVVFILGTVVYLAVLVIMKFPEAEEEEPPENTPKLRTVKNVYYLLFVLVWSIYPVVYALGPVYSGAISREAETWAYFFLEFPAKYGVAATNIFLVSKGVRWIGGRAVEELNKEAASKDEESIAAFMVKND